MTIHWRKTDPDEDGATLGHGLCIWRGSECEREGRLIVAFIAGFRWCRRLEDPVVQFAPERFPTDAVACAALREAIEVFLRTGKLYGAVAPGYFALANA